MGFIVLNVRISEVIGSSFLNKGRYKLWEVIRCKTMEDFVKKYKFVFVSATLESLPSQVSKEFLDAAEFGGTYDYSSSLSMDCFQLFLWIRRAVVPYWVTILK